MSRCCCREGFDWGGLLFLCGFLLLARFGVYLIAGLLILAAVRSALR